MLPASPIPSGTAWYFALQYQEKTAAKQYQPKIELYCNNILYFYYTNETPCKRLRTAAFKKQGTFSLGKKEEKAENLPRRESQRLQGRNCRMPCTRSWKQLLAVCGTIDHRPRPDGRILSSLPILVRLPAPFQIFHAVSRRLSMSCTRPVFRFRNCSILTNSSDFFPVFHN